MEAPGVAKLTDDEVRERFDAYTDGELPEAERAAVKARLEESPELAAEYARHQQFLQRLSNLGEGDPVLAPAPAEPAVDLLAGVQGKLHKRSGGRFYRTRFSRLAGLVPAELAVAAVLLVLLLAYLSMTSISGLRAAEPSGAQPTRAPR